MKEEATPELDSSDQEDISSEFPPLEDEEITKLRSTMESLTNDDFKGILLDNKINRISTNRLPLFSISDRGKDLLSTTWVETNLPLSTEVAKISYVAKMDVRYIKCMMDQESYRDLMSPIYDVKVCKVKPCCVKGNDSIILMPLSVRMNLGDLTAINGSTNPAHRHVLFMMKNAYGTLERTINPLYEQFLSDIGATAEGMRQAQMDDLERKGMRDQEKEQLGQYITIDIKAFPEFLPPGELIPEDNSMLRVRKVHLEMVLLNRVKDQGQLPKNASIS